MPPNIMENENLYFLVFITLISTISQVTPNLGAFRIDVWIDAKKYNLILELLFHTEHIDRHLS